MNEENMKKILGDAISDAYKVGEPTADEIKNQLERYERLDAEAEENAREDRIYRKKIVK